jgi:hypothetical protein
MPREQNYFAVLNIGFDYSGRMRTKNAGEPLPPTTAAKALQAKL